MNRLLITCALTPGNMVNRQPRQYDWQQACNVTNGVAAVPSMFSVSCMPLKACMVCAPADIRFNMDNSVLHSFRWSLHLSCVSIYHSVGCIAACRQSKHPMLQGRQRCCSHTTSKSNCHWSIAMQAHQLKRAMPQGNKNHALPELDRVSRPAEHAEATAAVYRLCHQFEGRAVTATTAHVCAGLLPGHLHCRELR